MERKKCLASFLGAYAAFWPIIFLMVVFFEFSQFKFKELEEILEAWYWPIAWLLVFISLGSVFCWSLLIGWYLIGKVSQTSFESFSWLEEIEDQEILPSEMNGEIQSGLWDSNAIGNG
ncbi:MAG: hypothetical protein ACFFB3_05880 [Candidatus Hodarchaeota archaeon]